MQPICFKQRHADDVTSSTVCSIGLRQLIHGARVCVAPAAAVKEADSVGEMVEAGTPSALYMAHPVVQEAAVRPGAYHKLAPCIGTLFKPLQGDELCRILRLCG